MQKQFDLCKKYALKCTWKTYKRVGDNESYIKFSEICNKLKRDICNVHAIYINVTENSIKFDVKYFY